MTLEDERDLDSDLIDKVSSKDDFTLHNDDDLCDLQKQITSLTLKDLQGSLDNTLDDANIVKNEKPVEDIPQGSTKLVTKDEQKVISSDKEIVTTSLDKDENKTEISVKCEKEANSAQNAESEKLEESDSEDEEKVTSSSVANLQHKFTNLKLEEPSSEEDDEEPSSEEDDEEPKINYLTRGPIIDHKNNGYRYSPLNPLHQQPHTEALSHQPVLEVNSSSNYFGANDGYFSYGQLSPESVLSLDPSSPVYVANCPSNFNQSPSRSQHELSTPDTTLSKLPEQFCDTFDFDSRSFEESYLPISPPQSISPLLKEGLDSSSSFGVGLGPSFETEDLKESEDLINIINNINKTSKIEQKDIPETELWKWRNMLEENENSLRDEMAIYLKETDHFQEHSFNSLEESIPGEAPLVFDEYEGPLTPPKSVSPFQDSLAEDYKNAHLDSYNELTVQEFLEGIHEINPEEFNIYLSDDLSKTDPSKARKIIQDQCKPNNLDHALRRLSPIPAKVLCKKDEDGDTCMMIVSSKPEDSPDFLENIFSLQEKVKEIRLCCDSPLGKAKRCKLCGNTDPLKFYTPLSLKNNQGDTALSCAIKTDHSGLVINYILGGILQCEEDFRRVFDEKGKSMLAAMSGKYPTLMQYVY